MSAYIPKAYCFATAAQWAKCIMHRLDPSHDVLLPAQRLGSYAVHIDGTEATKGVPPAAVDPHGNPFWLTEATGRLGGSPRLIVDRDWVWSFEAGSTIVSRVDRETLQPDLAIDVELEIRDITSDTREGIWILASGPAADGTQDVLVHFDCKGCPRERYPVPCEADRPVQVGCLNRGRELALLTGDKKRLLFVDAATGVIQTVTCMGKLSPSWSATQLATDTQNRIALWGLQSEPDNPAWLLYVLDSSGDTVEGPLTNIFSSPTAGQRPQSYETIRIAVLRQSVWFATDAGLWRLDGSEASGARESESTLLTPPLLSPDNDSERGWLRAEVSIDLPQSAALEAQVVTTDDANLIQKIDNIAADPMRSSEQTQEDIWALFDPSNINRFEFAGPTAAGVPISIPILEPKARWVMLRLSMVTAPGITPSALKKLRVLYPNVSLMQHLPAAFRGPKNDPAGTLRSIVGILESTTQRFDEHIYSIGSYLDPRTTPDEWLDYLGRWFDLPWDDELPADSRRRVLENAGEILAARGTRAGLLALLRALLGEAASVEIVDLTVDYAPLRVSGGGKSGGSLPALLAGSSMRTPTLGVKAVLGRARLCPDDGPFGPIVPGVRIKLTTSGEMYRTLDKLMRRVLLQYVPAGITLSIRWQLTELVASEAIGIDGIVLDANGPGVLGRNSAIGRTVLGGHDRGRLDDAGLEIGYRL